MNMYRAIPDRNDVLIILRSLRHGGTEKCSLDLAKALSAQGHKVHVAVLESIFEMEIPDGIEVHEVGTRAPKQVQIWLNQFNVRHDLSLVIATETRIPLSLKDLEIYYVLHIVPSERIDGGWLRQLKKRHSWRRRLHNKNIIAISQGVYNDVLDVIKAKPKSIRVIGDTFDFPTISALASAPVSYTLPNEYILYAGRICATKRLDRLLAIYQKAHTAIPLVIIGDGEEKDNIEQLGHELDIINNIQFIGWQDNPYPAIRNAKALLITSDSESFSATAVESLFLGTPIISTDCVGPKEIMGPKLRGYVIPKEREDTYVKVLRETMIDGQPNISNELEQRFGFRAIAQQFEKLIAS